jgi:biopolymer transport protein ExbB/biopolymer transport protein TolQ
MTLLASTFNFALAAGGAFGPKEIWEAATTFNKGIISLLLLLLLIEFSLVIERWIMYYQSESASKKFLKLFMDSLRRGDFEASKKAAATHNKSHIALVLKHSLDIYQYETQLKSTSPETSNLNVIQAVERAIVRGTTEVGDLLKKGMNSLGTIAACAPFIGLLGTVWGIIAIFSVLKTEGAGDINQLAGSIGEALATTALGLLVAIPAVWFFNILTSKQDKTISNINNAASQMVDEFIRRSGQ